MNHRLPTHYEKLSTDTGNWSQVEILAGGDLIMIEAMVILVQ